MLILFAILLLHRKGKRIFGDQQIQKAYALRLIYWLLRYELHELNKQAGDDINWVKF